MSRTSMSWTEIATAPATVHTLLRGSCVEYDTDDAQEALAAWESSRRFLVRAIRGRGSILDYGCANGFLLRCLLDWSGYPLTPYGTDIDAERLAAARDLFPDQRQHFVAPDCLGQPSLPTKFDQVYWAVGDNVDFDRPENLRWLAEVMALTAVDGRLVLGFYDCAERNRKRVDQLAATGLVPDGTVRAVGGRDESACWFDRPVLNLSGTAPLPGSKAGPRDDRG